MSEEGDRARAEFLDPHHSARPEMKPTARDRRLLLLYGITESEYAQIFSYQGDACAICRRPPKRNKLSVDHRHTDGLLRGLLCWDCNRAIAYLRDDVARAEMLLNYLTAPPAVLSLRREVRGRTGRATRRWRTKRERREALAKVAARLAELGYISHGERKPRRGPG